MVNNEKRINIAVGDFIDLGTYKAHYYSKGFGNISYIFISGAGTPSSYTDFYLLQNHLSDYGQTITFDHAGLGWSSKTDVPRNIENLTNELSILIDTVSMENVVLICHSLGSLEAIGYSQNHTDKVKGIIFLDGGSPEFYNTDSELSSKVLNRSLSFLNFVGINRFLGELGLILPMYGENDRYENIPNDLRALDKSLYYRHSGSYSNYKNIGYINENAETILQGNRLGDIPILILSSDNGDEWEQVQNQLSVWSNINQQFTIKNAKHYLHWTNYDEVVKHIDEFIQNNDFYE